jgi:ABC-type molybdate transport system ATPase subunit
LKEWNVPTLHVTHNVHEAERLAQRVIRLEGGKVQSSQTS